MKSRKYCRVSIYLKRNSKFNEVFAEIVQDALLILEQYVKNNNHDMGSCDFNLRILNRMQEYVVTTFRDIKSETKIKFECHYRFSSLCRLVNNVARYHEKSGFYGEPCQQEMSYDQIYGKFGIQPLNWDKYTRSYLFEVISSIGHFEIAEIDNHPENEEKTVDGIENEVRSFGIKPRITTIYSQIAITTLCYSTKFTTKKHKYKQPLVLSLLGTPTSILGVKISVFYTETCSETSAFLAILPVDNCSPDIASHIECNKQFFIEKGFNIIYKFIMITSDRRIILKENKNSDSPDGGMFALDEWKLLNYDKLLGWELQSIVRPSPMTFSKKDSSPKGNNTTAFSNFGG